MQAQLEIREPTSHESESVKIMRAQLEEAGCNCTLSDMTILRFFRGRKGELEKAIRAVQRHIVWRTENHVDDISLEYINEELTSGKLLVEGFDYQKRPCVIVHARKHNKDARDIKVMHDFIIHTLETVLKCSRPDEEKMVIVFDLSQFSMACMDYEAVRLLVEILQFNYPETLSRAIVVNAPFLFSACWMIIKLWLDQDTVGKVVFVAKDKLGDHLDLTTFTSMHV